jgi:dTDP-4-dehydrorhamnose reductase
LKKEILIIGIDSLIGASLKCAAQRIGYKIYGTSRRENSNHALLDVTWELDRWPDFPACDSMIVCASLNKLDQCQNDPALSFAVNVAGLEKAIKKYKSPRTQVIFLSSSHIFCGERPFVDETESPNPQNILGDNKAMGEKIVNEEGGLVVRVSKVIDPLFPRFVDWMTKLTNGETIEAYSNLLGSLVPLDSLIQALIVAIREDWRRIIHVSGPEEVSYYDMARILAINLCCNEDLVVPVKGEVVEAGARGRHTTLRTSQIVKDSNIELPDTASVISEWSGHFKDGENPSFGVDK